MPLFLKGFSASIACDNVDLEIFGKVCINDGKIATGWIASEVHKEFTVHWISPCPMSVDIYLDGRCAQTMSQRKDGHGLCKGVYVSGAAIRPFRFADLVLTDDDDVAGPVSDELGSIEIRVTRVAGFAESTELYRGRDFVDTGPIHETSKKAGVHAITLGETAAIRPVVVYTPYGREEVPFARLLFRYRPLELLRAKGIAPPGNPRASRLTNVPAGPSYLQRQREGRVRVKSEPITDDDADEGTLEAQLALVQNRLAKKRAKKGKTVVKQELSPIRVPSGSNGEVIDLT
ncbi:hypothetical protein C2E23DRAFT_902575 [Lenzites betulinus]|nr:hypothetical protein C2E23DRAFT_902575 [Lenzites betulinus]